MHAVIDEIAGSSNMAVDVGDGDDEKNIIENYNFEDGLTNWSGRGCNLVLHDSMPADGGGAKVLPSTGKYFAAATGRSQTWNGIQQDISNGVTRKLAYHVVAVVRISGSPTADVRATIWVQAPDGREQYIAIAGSQATDQDWVEVQGKFLLNGVVSKAVIYLEGPPAGTDILLNTMILKHAAKLIPPSPPPDFQNVAYGINIVKNSNLWDELTTGGSWFPLGSCTLTVVKDGAPRELPPMARRTNYLQQQQLEDHDDINGTLTVERAQLCSSGRYMLVTGRTQTWMGPAQQIPPDQLKLYVTYQVSAWVRVAAAAAAAAGGSSSTTVDDGSQQSVNVALGIDGKWVNGGQVGASADGRWYEVGGSFRIEQQLPTKVVVYVQGPSAGFDLMVAGLEIFPVDRKARFKHLKNQTDKLRKRNVLLKIITSSSSAADDVDDLTGAVVRVTQRENSFPLGTCIARNNTDNEDYVEFFSKNFNWAVFANELKWYWTEATQGNLNYADADQLLALCKDKGKKVRGHCIFWEQEAAVQPWVRSLSISGGDLMAAVRSRLTGLLTRYKGEFQHYDVNNEMLHGSFYRDRLGKDIGAFMFQEARRIDPSPVLFVNDYHVEDGDDPRSAPERYMEQVLALQAAGAAVGGIGVQGHIDSPVGSVVCDALDKLGSLGLPIWFTELDVSSADEGVRAEDLEVMLREAYAHPCVAGVVLWGFWELFMSRDNAHLVDAEGEVNEAGKRLLALKREWLSHAHGGIDEQGEFVFRGFDGTYTLEIAVDVGQLANNNNNKSKLVIKREFVVAAGGNVDDDDPLVVEINI